MEMLLFVIMNYLINLAASLRSNAITEKHRQKLQEKVKKEADALQAVQDRMSLKEQLKLVGTEAARRKAKDGITGAEKHLFHLLTEEMFQDDITQWLTAWKPQEKKRSEEKLSEQMVKALEKGGTENKYIDHFKTVYFDRIEKVVFSDPVLANWRLTLALNAAFERLDELEADIREEGLQTRDEVKKQHDETRGELAEMAAKEAHRQTKQFTPQQRNQAVERYRELALESCDIIDLANLPESDRHIAARNLELRRLYVPLRIKVEVTAGLEVDEEELERIEKQREQMRRQRTEEDDKEKRTSIGERLAEAGRLVLLGDPGAGKTTLIRWIATAYLLRLKQDAGFKDLPDVKTLPDKNWLPIVVRCRDLDVSCRTGSIDDVLCETFRKAQMTVEETAALQAVIRELLAEGKAILLVDGLDEISNTGIRARFSQQIERLHIAFPKAPIIVTSRIVGYREMHYRIGRGFEHATVSEFSKEDKDEFARRWCDVTELPERRESSTKELIEALHSADRIERLTGNPMLLTTLALVKRKVGKLPSRRADLYWEAVLVLLNWRSEVDEPIDHREAVPQLEYVAYEMINRGVQRLREDDIIELMEKMREEYPNIRAVKKHEPAEFLRMLERRTGILIEAGEVRHKGRSVPVFEFRHLTFQEYLAALALVDGKFPGRDKLKSLAEHIAPLAGQTVISKGEPMVRDNWREVLRLCAACCGDDDVGDVLLAILTPMQGEDPDKTTRPRAVLAALCLADEPNVSDDIANQILEAFARQVIKRDGEGSWQTTVGKAAMELVGTEWEKMLRKYLSKEFCIREPVIRWTPGSLLGRIGVLSAQTVDKKFHHWIEKEVKRLYADDNLEAIDAALTIMRKASHEEMRTIPGMVEGLLGMLEKNGPSANAGAWALFWLGKNEIWVPTQKETEHLISFISSPSSDIEAVFYSIAILGNAKSNQAVEVMIARLDEGSEMVRKIALQAIAKIQEDKTDRKLLSRDTDGVGPWLDPQDPIDENRVKMAAKRLKKPEEEVRQRYEKLAEKYKLRISWQAV
ncbi:MAG: NACHT domain-containing protein [Candidatus Aminicenantes bacterium]|nr:NACHT domain-containing protein [Candidatus Aminicenantes bacterium]NIM79148.1 NACHT domain-containing protein [Candidatus Aminicenantes bacterium]NIN18433.1 NACHT domain-containing protein [Candidatus Aminicenantes bacterium]NIN42321.1 NACHT domain-containing protein [Candidatus Aminicenantes bacterium]NIN85087.1 NACHT domain-containing protein [Candidatus Aminicenantes bacterium]